MRCQDATELLSAYFDEELNDSDAARVRQHVQTCQRCQTELQSFERIHVLAGQFQEPKIAAPSWESFAARLQVSQQQAPQQSTLLTERRRSRTKDVVIIVAALAASVLIMLAVRRPEKSDRQTDGHAHSHSSAMAGVMPTLIDFQEVVSNFQHDAMHASEAFSALYAGEEVSIENAEQKLGYRPQVKQALPAGVQLVSTRVLKLPECNCVEGECLCGPNGCNCLACVCERPDGSKFMLVENCKSQKTSFGDLPTQLVRRGNRELKVTQTDKGLAASWEGARARMTAIGLRDISELDGLLASN